MNQAQVEPGNLCHEYMCYQLCHSSDTHGYFNVNPFFPNFSWQFSWKQKTKCCIHSLTMFCSYLLLESRHAYLPVHLRTFDVPNRHNKALYTKRTFCLPDAWPREICRVSLFVCLRACVYDMFTKYLFIMQRSGSVLAGLGGKWRVLFVSLAVSGGCFAQIQGGNW